MVIMRAIKRVTSDMTMLETDKVFAGSIPENYDHYMVPLIFEPYAADIARRRSVLVAKRRFGNRRGQRGCHSRLGAKTAPGRELYRNRPQPADGRLRRIATTSRHSYQMASSGCSGAAV